MAPAAATPAKVAKDDNDADQAKLAVWKDALYDKVREAGREDDSWSQEELLDLDVIPKRDNNLLMRVVQGLSDDKLFFTLRESSGQVSWKWREVDEAQKYRQCTGEQEMVYSLIDYSGGDGVWTQTLQKRLNINDTVLKTLLKQLQTKNLIVPFKNVEHPNKKMYIKASIQPSDRATGGPWYTDQNLDEAFIEDLQRVIFDYVKQHSSYVSRHTREPRAQAPKKGVLKGGLEKGKKRDAEEMEEPPAKTAKTSTTQHPRKDVLLPLPAGYTNYPTVRGIARFLTTSGITNNTILSEDDVRKLVDVLVWDNLLEPVKVSGKIGFRVSRVAKQPTEGWAGREDPDCGPIPYISAYTEAPCGRCPVFDLCEDGGPVSASNCVYFTKWLGLD